MCGICGIYGDPNRKIIQEMLESIRHRGPDVFEIKITGNHSFGAVRLALVSKQKGDQPAVFDDDLVVLFNGEIYNYREIAAKLAEPLGSDFCEVEVIKALYKQRGYNGISLLKGMFAMAILDGDTLILARDKFGIKPLFYCRIGKTFLFASELKALLRHPDVTPELDIHALEETAVLGFIYTPEMTPFKGIYQVAPGTVMKITPDTTSKMSFYRVPSAFYKNEAIVSPAAAERLQQLMREAVEKLIKQGEKEKGIYLSGGIDSSTLAVLASEVSDKPILTFTLFDSDDSQDIHAARQVAKAIGARHFEFKVGINDYLNELPGYIYHYENLVAGGVFGIQGGVAFHLLSKRVAEHVRVAFSGEGADELFGGYYWEYLFPLGFADRIKARLNKLNIQGQTKELIDNLFPLPENEQLYRVTVFNLLMNSGLTNHHLWCIDHSSSAFGFEIRPAYLDDELTDFALSLPIDFKVSKTKMETKLILKEAAMLRLKKYGLMNIALRKKQGMPAAVQNTSRQVNNFAWGKMALMLVSGHPLTKYLANPLEALLFDLFHWIFIEQKGRLPADFNINDFCQERPTKTAISQY